MADLKKFLEMIHKSVLLMKRILLIVQQPTFTYEYEYTLLKYLLYVLCRFVQYFSITSPFFWNETLDSLKHKHDELNTVFSIPNYRHLLSFWHFLDLSWVICLCSYALSSLGDGVFKKHRIYLPLAKPSTNCTSSQIH